MEPRQFSHWGKTDLDEYYLKKLSVGKIEDLIYTNFETSDGSMHSLKHCGLRLISDEYAQFFLENKLWELFDSNDDIEFRWLKYENKIKAICLENNILYEGY